MKLSQGDLETPSQRAGKRSAPPSTPPSSSRVTLLLARRHVLERVDAGRDLVVAEDQREPRAQLVGQSPSRASACCPLDSSTRAARARAGPAPAARRVPQRGVAQRRDEQVEPCQSRRLLLLLDRHHQAVLADREADARAPAPREPSDSASPS